MECEKRDVLFSVPVIFVASSAGNVNAILHKKAWLVIPEEQDPSIPNRFWRCEFGQPDKVFEKPNNTDPYKAFGRPGIVRLVG